MTLCTTIAVKSPGISPDEIFEEAVRLAGGIPEQAALATINEDAEGVVTRMMPLGLGLRALVWVSYCADGSELPLDDKETSDLAKAMEARAHNEALAPDANEDDYIFLSYEPKRYIDVYFDTSYGYKAANGARCGALHAWIVSKLINWLEARGSGYSWYDESGDGWLETWLGKEEREQEGLQHDSKWGSLGDPDFGDPDSMIPCPSSDPRYDFLQSIVSNKSGSLEAMLNRLAEDDEEFRNRGA